MDANGLVSGARVVALPMVERFRGIDVREALLLEHGGTWAEWSPFTEYDDAEAARWLGSALDVLRTGPQHAGASIRVNATVPGVPPAAVPGVLARFPGCRTAKVKVAERGQALADDIARVRAVRDVLGPSGRIRVDANAAWSLAEATDALTALMAFDLEYAEQPVATITEFVELRHRLAGGIRIAADESIRKAEDPLAVARAGAADLLVLKSQPLGGPARALAIAAEAGLPVVTSSALETSVGLAAAVRFAAAIDRAQPGVDFDHGLGTAALLAADVTAEPLLPVDGRLPVRDVRPDPDLLERYAAAPERRTWWLDRLHRCLQLVPFSGVARGFQDTPAGDPAAPGR